MTTRKAKPAPKTAAKSLPKSASAPSGALTLQSLKAKTKLARKKRQLDKRRLRDLLALVRRRLEDIVEAFYDIGDALEEVTRKELYHADGVGSFAEWLKKESLMSDVQARKFITIAQGMSRENALSAGPERAYELVRLAAEDPDIKSADALTQPDATIDGKLVKDLSVDDIAAIRRARREKAGEQPPENPIRSQHNEAARLLQTRLRNEGANGALVRAIHRGEHWVIEIELHANDAIRLHVAPESKAKAKTKPKSKARSTSAKPTHKKPSKPAGKTTKPAKR